MRLSIFLFQESINSFDNLVREKCLNGENCFEELPLNKELSFECKAYLQRERKKQPTWLKFLEDYFKLDMYNTTNSFIIFVRVMDRVFAATFGYGFNALDRSKIEPQFGLKVTLNSIGADQIDTIDTRNVDLVTKQKRTHLNVGSSIGQFGINEYIDLVRYVSGRPKSSSFANKLSGSDSLGITKNCKLVDLGEICKELLQTFTCDNYKSNFQFIDYLKPLSKKDTKVNSLNNELNEHIKKRDSERLAIANPEIPDNSIVKYKIYTSRKCSKDLDELTLEGIYDFLEDKGIGDNFLETVKIVGYDGDGNPKTSDYKLKEYLVCELKSNNDTFIYSLGQWYSVDNDFIKQVKDKVKNIPDSTNQLLLPPLKNKESEGSYNERVSKSKGWLLVDKKLFSLDGMQNKFEICDILTDNKEFLCVKKMTSSATLSHLFSQATVSARLLRSDSRVEAEIKKRYETFWKDRKYNDANEPTFIYVIPTAKKGSLSDCMFFFSLINLVDHVEMIKAMGYKVSLCKVDLTK